MTDRAPPLAPAHPVIGTVYLVLDDFGALGRVYREMDETEADPTHIVRHMVRGEFNRPLRVVAFNVDEGWSRDVSAEIAEAVADVADEQRRSLSRTAREFLEHHLPRGRDIPREVYS